jgi:hypothetical protein
MHSLSWGRCQNTLYMRCGETGLQLLLRSTHLCGAAACSSTYACGILRCASSSAELRWPTSHLFPAFVIKLCSIAVCSCIANCLMKRSGRHWGFFAAFIYEALLLEVWYCAVWALQ